MQSSAHRHSRETPVIRTSANVRMRQPHSSRQIREHLTVFCRTPAVTDCDRLRARASPLVGGGYVSSPPGASALVDGYRDGATVYELATPLWHPPRHRRGVTAFL